MNEDYSWAHTEGINLQASYDRVYLIGEYMSLWEVVTAWQNMLAQFTTTNRTRAMCNMQIPITVMQEIQQNPECFKEWSIEALYPYPQSTNRAGYANLIVGHNRCHRSVREEYITLIRNRVQNVLEENMFDLDRQVARIQELVGHGYRFATDIQPEQLHELRGETFGWSLEQVQNEVQRSRPRNIGLVDENNNLISCAMVSQWESTEWATRQWLQRRWLIQPLLMVLHAANIQRDRMGNNGITPITCEARYDRSVRVGVQVGMTLDLVQWAIGVHPNHVTIWWSDQDEWNMGEWTINNMDFSNLRSFVTMYLRDEMYDEECVRRILQTAGMETQ